MPRTILVVVPALVLLWACGDPCADSGTVCTVAGIGSPGADANESRATKSPLYGPMDVAIWKDATDFFVGDWNNHKIRHVADGEVETIVGTAFLGDGDPEFEERNPPGVPGTDVALNHPTQIEWSPATEKLLVPSWHNHRVREWTPETGNSLVVCADTDITDGNGANAGFAGDGGPAADALFAFPNSIAVDADTGDFWVLDQRNARIRHVTADYSLIETIAGSGVTGYEGDGGDALDAAFMFWTLDDLQPEPSGAVEFDGDHMLYIADTSNHAIRTVDLDSGLVDTLVGGDQSMPGGACDTTTLCYPRDVEIGPDGRLWIADEGNHVIRVYDLDAGAMEVAVGTFEQGDAEEGALALEADLNRPYGIDIADDGTLLIADTYNHRIRKVTP